MKNKRWKLKARNTNSLLARLRILWYIHVCVSQVILSLVVNKRLRISQYRQAVKRYSSSVERLGKKSILKF